MERKPSGFLWNEDRLSDDFNVVRIDAAIDKAHLQRLSLVLGAESYRQVDNLSCHGMSENQSNTNA